MSYESKIRAEFAGRRTQKGVDVLSATRLDDIDDWKTTVKDLTISACLGVNCYEFFKGAGLLPSSLPDIPQWDKIGHFGVGLLVARTTGALHGRYTDWKDKPTDVASKIESRRKHFFERSVAENSMMIGQAFGWEYWEIKYAPLTGAVFDMADVFACTLGQAVNTAINVHYLGKMTKLYNATMERKEELHLTGESPCEYDIPKPILAAPITKPKMFLRDVDRYFVEANGST